MAATTRMPDLRWTQHAQAAARSGGHYAAAQGSFSYTAPRQVTIFNPNDDETRPSRARELGVSLALFVGGCQRRPAASRR